MLEVDRNWRLAVGGLLALAAVSALAWLGRYPLEAHEIFVAETAREMADRGDWLVPYFNGEPRLNKPPLSYWLTGFFAWLQGASVDAVYARLPSALAGIGLVAVTLLSGSRLFDRRTGLIAGLVMLSCGGFLQYSHNARPEMLYAFWCALGLTALVLAWQSEARPGRQRLWAGLAWVGFALATLTKGPQLPALLIAGFAGFLAWEKFGWRRSMAILRPLSGLALLLALCLPWWWLLRQSLGPEALAGSQLEGSLLKPEWTRILDPYYLYRTLQLALPWVILFPVMLGVAAVAWRDDHRLRLLLLLILVPALLLSLGPQRRWYYMMPTLMPLCLLLAATLTRIDAEPVRWARLRRWLVWAFPGQWLLILLLLLGLAAWADPQRYPELRQSVLLALPPVALLGLVFRRWPGDRLAATAAAAALFVLAGGSVYGGGSGLLDANKREPLRIAPLLAAAAGPDTPVAALGTDTEPLIFYARRRVQGLRDGEQLRAWLSANRRAGGDAPVLVARRAALAELPQQPAWRLLHAGPDGSEDALVLVAFAGTGSGTEDRP